MCNVHVCMLLWDACPLVGWGGGQPCLVGGGRYVWHRVVCGMAKQGGMARLYKVTLHTMLRLRSHQQRRSATSSRGLHLAWDLAHALATSLRCLRPRHCWYRCGSAMILSWTLCAHLSRQCCGRASHLDTGMAYGAAYRIVHSTFTAGCLVCGIERAVLGMDAGHVLW